MARFGNILGGAVQGFNVGANVAQNRAKLEQEQQAAEAKARSEQQKKLRSAFDANQKSLLGSAEIYTKGILDSHEQQLLAGEDAPLDRDKLLSDLDQGVFAPALQTIETAEKTGVLSPSEAQAHRVQIAAKRQALMSTLTAQQQREQKAREEGAIARATDQATRKPQTDAGKIIFDVALAEEHFGEGSPQAAAVAEQKNDKDKPNLTETAGLRKEFTRLSGEFLKARDGFVRVNASPDSPAGDLALMFNFMKVQDPGGRITEDDFAQAAATGSLGDRLQVGVERVLSGKRLTAKQRADFIATAREVFAAQVKKQRENEESFKGLAKRQKMDPDNVVVDFIGDLDVTPVTAESVAKMLGFSVAQIRATMAAEDMSPQEILEEAKRRGMKIGK